MPDAHLIQYRLMGIVPTPFNVAMLDGAPVPDLKPYVPAFDGGAAAHVG